MKFLDSRSQKQVIARGEADRQHFRASLGLEDERGREYEFMVRALQEAAAWGNPEQRDSPAAYALRMQGRQPQTEPRGSGWKLKLFVLATQQPPFTRSERLGCKTNRP
jgi:hypothetical protein